jgi:CelD/BcsL family acetyltransferase involved in cellulose biosynthesis
MIRLVTGEPAACLLAQASFVSAWENLYERCGWATPFQQAGFVTTWYEAYQERYQPVILAGYSPDGELTGLFTLAASNDSGALVVAGGHQAEYHAWLAASEEGTFVEDALDALRERFPTGTLVLNYVPPGTPLDWARAGRPWARYCRLEPVQRPLLRISRSPDFRAHLEAKYHPQRCAKLRRQGELTFGHLTDPADLEAIFDALVTYYDVRQLAVGGIAPFREDPLKKRFHLGLMRVPGLLHTTVLRIGGRLLAGHLGIAGRRTVALGILAHSPFDSQHSPGILHLRLLAEHLANSDFQTFDLTPGGDPWKDTIANEHDEAHILKVFLNRFQVLRHDARKGLRTAVRRSLGLLRVPPNKASEAASRILRVGLRRLPGLALRTTWAGLCRLWHGHEQRVYLFPLTSPRPIEPGDRVAKDSLEDVTAVRPGRPDENRQEFVARVLGRLDKGAHVYTRMETEHLAQHAWMVTWRGTPFFTRDVDCAYEFPAGAEVIYDVRADPGVGSGHWEPLLRRMLQDAGQSKGAACACLVVPGRDIPLQRAAESVGFIPGCTFHRGGNLRKAWHWLRKGFARSNVSPSDTGNGTAAKSSSLAPGKGTV